MLGVSARRSGIRIERVRPPVTKCKMTFQTVTFGYCSWCSRSREAVALASATCGDWMIRRMPDHTKRQFTGDMLFTLAGNTGKGRGTMAMLMRIGLATIIGLSCGFVAGTLHERNTRTYPTTVTPRTAFVFTDTGDFVSVTGVMKAVDPISIAYPANAFLADCTRSECRTAVALGDTSSLDMERGFGLSKIREFSADRVVFEEDGGSLSMVLGKHRKFTYTLDRKAKTLRAVGRPDETTNDTGQNAVFELIGLGFQDSHP